ncbi:cupin domain-containing protein [Mycobacterium aquaticum]|uniref:(S)-ureidoglycine aminohydrolase cupin domain-containing protein n=1 Tax=Mycobacterium aquaticum TaxID=1927124 RepID=A0A1W9ZZI4_9MYCO|nr:cupin domain-containing protein [Mycobacterium aquaticum]ORA22906.1 hypothetical protein BST13_35820 [Mycobacterium aquaticum]
MTHIPAPAEMEPTPIVGATILSGEPKAAGSILYSTPDGRGTVGLFSCTPGKFRFTLEAEEFTHLLAGHIVIETDAGETIDATAGDTYILPAGQSMLIDIRETITDVYLSWSDA